MFVIHVYKEVLGTTVCHIYSGELNVALWTQDEAEAQLAALKAAKPGLGGMMLPIELVSTPLPG